MIGYREYSIEYMGKEYPYIEVDNDGWFESFAADGSSPRYIQFLAELEEQK